MRVPHPNDHVLLIRGGKPINALVSVVMVPEAPYSEITVVSVKNGRRSHGFSHVSSTPCVPHLQARQKQDDLYWVWPSEWEPTVAPEGCNASERASL